MQSKVWEAFVYPTEGILIICAKGEDWEEADLQITYKVFKIHVPFLCFLGRPKQSATNTGLKQHKFICGG